MREAILRLAAQEQLDSVVLIAAIADILGLTAAQLDLHGRPEQQASLDTRMDSVVERARAMHRRTLARLVTGTTNAVTRVTAGPG